MRILIDGYNLIRRIPELSMVERQDLEEGRRHLIEELSGYRAGKGHRITVVFDGAGAVHLGGSSEKIKGISVIYSPQGRTADQVIVSRCRDGQADLLVTADRGIIDQVGSSDVTTVGPDRFWARVEMEKYSRLKGVDHDNGELRPGGGKGRKLSKKDRRNRRRLDRL